MSVQTGITPTELLALDAEMFDALAEAVEQAWPLERELAAASVEIAHAQLLAFVRVNSKPGTRLPEPLRIERPAWARADEDGRERMTVGELARLPGLTAELRRAE